MALPSSNPSVKIRALPTSPDLNVAAFSLRPDSVNDAFDQGARTAQAMGDSILLRPAQTVAQAAQANDVSDTVRANMILRPLLEKVSAAQSARDLQNAQQGTQIDRVTNEANLSAEQGRLTGNRLTEAAMQHPDYQSSIIDAKITTAQHNAAQADLALKTLLATGADITNEEVLKAKKKVRDAQYDLDVLGDEQKVNDLKRQATTAGAKGDVINAGVALKTLSNPSVQQAIVDTNTAGVATNRMAAITNLARQVALGSMAPTAITPEDDAKLRLAAQNAGVAVIDPSGRPRPLADVSKEFAAKVSTKEAEPILKEIRDASTASQGALSALQQIKGLGNVSTGALFVVPGVPELDRVLAQFGVEGSQKREVFAAMNTRLVPLVRQPGSVSDFEQKTYGRSLPGPGISDKTNAAMVAGLYNVAQRNTQRPAFYNALLQDGISSGKIEQVWNNYLNTNPSILDGNTVNNSALNPDQYLAALRDPAATAQSLAPTDPAVIATLPRGNTDAEIAAASPFAPFVAVRNARGVEVAAANPKYWRSIITDGQTLTQPDTSSPQSTAYTGAFAKALSTPINVLLQATPTAIPTTGPIAVPIRRK